MRADILHADAIGELDQPTDDCALVHPERFGVPQCCGPASEIPPMQDEIHEIPGFEDIPVHQHDCHTVVIAENLATFGG